MVLHGLFEDSSSYKTSFVGIGRATVYLDKVTAFVGCPYYLFQAGFVMLNDIVGCLYNVSSRTVVLFQTVDTYIAVVLLEIKDIVNVCPTESVDTLGIISHHADILKPISQGTYNQVLGVVCILILIYQDIAESVLVFCQDFREDIQQFISAQ